MKIFAFCILLILPCIIFFPYDTISDKEESTTYITETSNITKITQQSVGIFELNITDNNMMLEDFINDTSDVCVFFKGVNSKEIYVATKDIQKKYFNPTYKINKNKDLVIHFDYKEKNNNNTIHLYKIVLDKESNYDCTSVKMGDGKFKDFILKYFVDVDFDFVS